MSKFDRYQKASKYILSKAEVKWFPLNLLNLNQAEQIKDWLVVNHTIEELKTLRISSNAEAESSRNITLKSAFLATVLTTLFTFFAAYVMLYANMKNNITMFFIQQEIQMAVLNLDEGEKFTNEKLQEIQNFDLLEAAYKGIFENTMPMHFLYIILILGMVFVYITKRQNDFYKIVALNNIVNEALEEKLNKKEGEIKMSNYEIIGEFIYELQLILNTNVPKLDSEKVSDIKAEAHEALAEILEKYKVI